MRAHVNLNFAVHAEPVAGEGEVGPLHDLEAEDVTVETLGVLEIVGPDKIVVELGDRHGILQFGLAGRTTLQRSRARPSGSLEVERYQLSASAKDTQKWRAAVIGPSLALNRPQRWVTCTGPPTPVFYDDRIVYEPQPINY
jgi:hypothetical protein